MHDSDTAKVYIIRETPKRRKKKSKRSQSEMNSLYPCKAIRIRRYNNKQKIYELDVYTHFSSSVSLERNGPISAGICLYMCVCSWNKRTRNSSRIIPYTRSKRLFYIHSKTSPSPPVFCCYIVLTSYEWNEEQCLKKKRIHPVLRVGSIKKNGHVVSDENECRKIYRAAARNSGERSQNKNGGCVRVSW